MRSGISILFLLLLFMNLGIVSAESKELEQQNKSVESASDYKPWSDKWSKCASDSECTVVKAVCGEWKTVNKKFVGRAQRMIDKESSEVVCNFVALPKPIRTGCVQSECSAWVK
jgi:hypothetical protein